MAFRPVDEQPLAASTRGTALLRGVTYFGAWTAVAFATTELQYAAQPATGIHVFGRLIRLALASCWLWAVFTPAILAFSRRFRIDRKSWPRMLPLHLAAAALATFMDVAMMAALAPLVNPDAAVLRVPLHIMFLRQLFLYSVCYFVIVALAHVRYYAGLSYERDLRAVQLERAALRRAPNGASGSAPSPFSLQHAEHDRRAGLHGPRWR